MKKYLSVILAITLICSAMPVASQAAESTASLMQEVISKDAYATKPKNKTEKSSKFKYAFIFLATGLIATLSGLIGYKIGNDRRVADEKEITITTFSENYWGFPDNEVTHLGAFDDIESEIRYIDRLFYRDIPKLSKENEFNQPYLLKLSVELNRLHLMFYKNKNNKNCTDIAKELEDQYELVDAYNYRKKRITVGYLKRLLKDTQNLLKKALPYRDMCTRFVVSK